MILRVFKGAWVRFWMLLSGTGPLGRVATWLAILPVPPHYGRYYLARLHKKGYVSPSASIHHRDLQMGEHIFIDDRVLIYQFGDGGPVRLEKGVHIHRDTIIQTGFHGTMDVGANTYIQPRCTFSAFKSPIKVGKGVQIAPNCSFYSYDHSIASGAKIMEQPLQTKGGIVIDDDAWLGVGVTVLDGVRIGKGAVVGAGSVVIKDVPEGAVVMGVPACIVKMRDI